MSESGLYVFKMRRFLVSNSIVLLSKRDWRQRSLNVSGRVSDLSHPRISVKFQEIGDFFLAKSTKTAKSKISNIKLLQYFI